ncbi:hypothetical protein VQL36_09525 [Chengkuizengella sp. SCS-71B]|uniref:hypothetical protein n=1 Tax=Chengkuizengella sp. SCS-71B TaxID=3115290 RepID=UPI0032C233FB
MNTKRRLKKRYFIIFITFILFILVIPIFIGGYSISESLVVRYSFPKIDDGEIVYEKKFEDDKVIVWKTDNESIIKLIEREWGVFYRSNYFGVIHTLTPDKKMRLTRSVRGYNHKSTLIGAEILDKEIVKVIVSIHDRHKNISSLSEAKEKSNVYIEMDVKNGYAAHYSYLNSTNVGSFTFLGLNSGGEVISIN